MKNLKSFKTNLNHLFGLFLIGITLSLGACQEQDQVVPQAEPVAVEADQQGDVHEENAPFLRQQESLGGHTIERHVAKSDSYLRNRLNTSNISAASTFYELNQAGQVIVNAINANSNSINNWKNGSSSRISFTYTHHRAIGKILYRGSSSPVASSRFLVVLQKKSSAPNGYYVLTSYPN
ncbi:hypothetical protein LVD15_23300 [Fulvivirga maritima]|uniref:RNase A-like domain-containing protein n=1 Tax=Fulvivirga maritima TaxID=2904247 RepID=UPI001F1B2F0E|nr:RNase A-like domain-containing protein [Fulvivirga maritima]UII26196.1 hypothetical protein LVD15_23300 [Fulvivirga maritima]